MTSDSVGICWREHGAITQAELGLALEWWPRCSDSRSQRSAPSSGEENWSGCRRCTKFKSAPENSALPRVCITQGLVCLFWLVPIAHLSCDVQCVCGRYNWNEASFNVWIIINGSCTLLALYSSVISPHNSPLRASLLLVVEPFSTMH